MENKQQTAVEWIIEQLQAPCRGIPSHIIEQAKQMEQDQMKRVALHFIVVGGQGYGCNWNEMNFTDEWNKLRWTRLSNKIGRAHV